VQIRMAPEAERSHPYDCVNVAGRRQNIHPAAKDNGR
jgi:hypothetical protein